MKRSDTMTKIVVFLSLFTLFGSPGMAQKQTKRHAHRVPISVDRIVMITVSGRNLTFYLHGTVKESCLSFEGFTLNIIEEDSLYWFQPYATKIPGKECDSGQFSIPTFIPFETLSRHVYTFRFWKDDSTTIDTTFRVH